MGRTILCPHCKSTFNEDILKERNSDTVCLVCGKSLLSGGESDTPPEKKETKTYYYYEKGGVLTPTVYDRAPLYTFEAIDIEDAKQQLKKVMPNCPLFSVPSKPSCPFCGSKEIQVVPTKSGFFAPSSVDRACTNCGRILKYL